MKNLVERESYAVELRRCGVFQSLAVESAVDYASAAAEAWRKHFRGWASKDVAYEYAVGVKRLEGDLGVARVYTAEQLERDLRGVRDCAVVESGVEWRDELEPGVAELEAIDNDVEYNSWLAHMSA